VIFRRLPQALAGIEKPNSDASLTPHIIDCCVWVLFRFGERTRDEAAHSCRFLDYASSILAAQDKIRVCPPEFLRLTFFSESLLSRNHIWTSQLS
jgi:hypothetical protein